MPLILLLIFTIVCALPVAATAPRGIVITPSSLEIIITIAVLISLIQG
jgi:hypothetical protein